MVYAEALSPQVIDEDNFLPASLVSTSNQLLAPNHAPNQSPHFQRTFLSLTVIHLKSNPDPESAPTREVLDWISWFSLVGFPRTFLRNYYSGRLPHTLFPLTKNECSLDSTSLYRHCHVLDRQEKRGESISNSPNSVFLALINTVSA